MGTWDTEIKGNDTTLDVYSSFFERYNNGEKQAFISNKIKEEFKEYFLDADDKNNALFGLALAQWETKSLEPEIYNNVKEIIEKGKDIELWKELGADKETLHQRTIALETFLSEISIEKLKAKRRVKTKRVWRSEILFNLKSPDNKKVCKIQKNYVNNKYLSTSCMLSWETGGSGVFQFNKETAKLTASFINSHTIEIIHDNDISFSQKRETFYYSRDEGIIIYKSK